MEKRRKTHNLVNDRALLIIDNFTSHLSEKFEKRCSEEKIQILNIPPHTSHLLQPLDLVLFGAFKNKIKNTVMISPMTAQSNQIITMFSAFQSASTISNVIASFKRSGIISKTTKIPQNYIGYVCGNDSNEDPKSKRISIENNNIVSQNTQELDEYHIPQNRVLDFFSFHPPKK